MDKYYFPVEKSLFTAVSLVPQSALYSSTHAYTKERTTQILFPIKGEEANTKGAVKPKKKKEARI